MTTPRTHQARSSQLALVGSVAVALLLSGCGAGSTGGGEAAHHSSGIPIVAGEWAFDPDVRCEADSEAPGCRVTDDDGNHGVAALAAAGSMFTSDLDVTITYRGGLLVRETGPDSVNAEARGVLAFFDVTFPEKQKDREDLLTLSLGAGGPEDFTWQSAFMGNNAVTDVWPNGSGTGSAFPYAPAPGETLTFAYYSATAGPTSLLGEDDPYLVLLSD